MAGIGFELRKILRPRTYFSLVQAYGYAGAVSAGPWLLSILGILLLGFIALSQKYQPGPVAEFQVSVTYLIGSSLIFTGPVQLVFTRYLADVLFSGAKKSVISLILLMMGTVTVSGAAVAVTVAYLFFRGTSPEYQWLMGTGFVELCGVWILTIMGTSLKDYRSLVFWYFTAYATILVSGIYLGKFFGLEGYLLAFDVGQMVLLASLGSMVIRQFPGFVIYPEKILQRQKIFWSLSLSGLFFNAAIWADKILFWFSPDTGAQVIGPLRASPIYDVPIFLSYLLIVPGMAAFLFRLETDFVEAYDTFNKAIVEGGIFSEVSAAKQGMINATRAGLWDVGKVQGATAILALVFASPILQLLGYSHDYVRIFRFDIVGVSLQLLLMSILNVYFYLDLRTKGLLLSAIFLFGNVVFTLASLYAGPFFYGTGFMVSLFLADTIGLYLLGSDLKEIDFLAFAHLR